MITSHIRSQECEIFTVFDKKQYWTECVNNDQMTLKHNQVDLIKQNKNYPRKTLSQKLISGQMGLNSNENF